MAVQALDQHKAITDWFETDFKEAAKATTKTSRLEDGRLSYSFSVVNGSGFDFDRFAFRIKVIDKTNDREIGTAKINAGKWAAGEKKNFKSRLSIPADAKSLSFVMYSNSLDYEAAPAGAMQTAGNDLGDALKGMGEALTGADGSGGVFGELFGTGGMPQGTTVTKTTTTKTVNGKTTKTTTTTTTRPAGTSATRQGTSRPASQNSRPANQAGTFTERRNEKKLNKKRLGRSGWTMASLITGLLFLMSSAGSTDTPEARIAFAIVGAILVIIAGVMKLALNAKAKRIRTYEAKINKKGNTSIDDLASYVGKPFNKVADDLQAMIADGFFPEAYVDINNRLLVMTRNGEPIESVEKSAAQNKKARGNAPESIDDLIAMTDDTEIKNKLKSLRTITKKIDARVEEVPELEKQVKDFREKYYPEVVRLTDTYNDKIADMGKTVTEKPKEEVVTDASGAPVLNTNPNYLEEQAADIKSQLISLIDSVIEASENLLERLHEDDIMDITTDIQRLQTTLASKGLLDSDFDI